MKLYVEFPNCGRIFLSSRAQFRHNLPEIFTLRCPKNGTTCTFRRSDVKASSDSLATIGGGIIGLIAGGLIAGPIGLILGGLLGGGIGGGADSQDIEAAKRFNQS